MTRRLSDLYDADRRRVDAATEFLAQIVHIPHPLHHVTYADGTYDGEVARADGHRCTPACRDRRPSL